MQGGADVGQRGLCGYLDGGGDFTSCKVSRARAVAGLQFLQLAHSEATLLLERCSQGRQLCGEICGNELSRAIHEQLTWVGVVVAWAAVAWARHGGRRALDDDVAADTRGR